MAPTSKRTRNGVILSMCSLYDDLLFAFLFCWTLNVSSSKSCPLARQRLDASPATAAAVTVRGQTINIVLSFTPLSC